MSEYLPHIFRTLDRSQKKIKPDVLLTKLKTWRRARSALLGIPPFKIASNDVLVQLSSYGCVLSRKKITLVRGIGKAFVDKHYDDYCSNLQV